MVNTNQTIIKNFLMETMQERKCRYYFHDSKLFFINDEDLNEIDLSVLELKLQVSSDPEEFFTDLNTEIEYDMFSRPNTKRIIPVLFTTDELEAKGNLLRYEKMPNGNLVAFLDTYLGQDGRFINIGEFEAHKSLLGISMQNLNAQYNLDVIFEEISPNSKVYKLIEPIHPGYGRSMMLIAKVQNKIKDLFGDTVYIITSDTGHLYACDFSIDLSDIISKLFLGSRQILENHFDIFTFAQGKYEKSGSGFREIAFLD